MILRLQESEFRLEELLLKEDDDDKKLMIGQSIFNLVS